MCVWGGGGGGGGGQDVYIIPQEVPQCSNSNCLSQMCVPRMQYTYHSLADQTIVSWEK